MKQTKKYTLRIDERVYNRISKHIRLLKRLNGTLNQNEWMEKAVLEKIDREKDQRLGDFITPEKHFTFIINSEVDAIIEERVELIRRFRTFTKKQWILEALEEKLNKEEKAGEINSQLLIKNMIREVSEKTLSEN